MRDEPQEVAEERNSVGASTYPPNRVAQPPSAESPRRWPHSPTSFKDGRWGVLLPIVLVLLPGAMLYPLWSNPVSAGEDDVIYYYPLRVVTGRALSAGELPMTDPLTAMGTPVLGDPQSAVFHPATWLFAVTAPMRAYTLSILLAFALTAGGMWCYLRSLGLGCPACAVGVLAMTFCGFFVGHRVHLSMILTASMLPWWLWGIERLRRGAGGALAVLVPAGVAAVFAGHWPTVIHMGLIAGAYAAFRARPIGRALAVLSAAGVLVAVATAPQWQATLAVMEQITRARLGYATAGENSYFPASVVLWLFPFLMGGRIPNAACPQAWWGGWHFCEMIGYAGLATLVLAGSAVWVLFRRASAERSSAGGYRPVVRTWVWIGLGAGVFMLGYYLPTYRLVHALPVLGIVRCPARMILALDAALAVLAAVAVQGVLVGGVEDRLRRAVRRGATRVLPIAMVLTLLALAVAAWALSSVFAGGFPQPFVGGPDDALGAVRPWNPAVWVPLVLMLLTGGAAVWWLRDPRRRWWVLAAVLAADLSLPARFVDVPPADYPAPDPRVSPAGDWLAGKLLEEHGYSPNRTDRIGTFELTWRVWGLGDPYGRRQPELLLPRTNAVQGIAAINGYGPMQNPDHAHLLGFRIFGTNRDWRRVVRQNIWLRRYGVRYLICESGSEYEREIRAASYRSVRPGDSAGPNLLGPWTSLRRVEVAERVAQPPLAEDCVDEETIRVGASTHPPPGYGMGKGSSDEKLRLRAPALWLPAEAWAEVRFAEPGTYRIDLEVRGPGDGIANFLLAEVVADGLPAGGDGSGPTSLLVRPERTGRDWRRFEWVFEVPPEAVGPARFRLLTMSERPVEVRAVALRRAPDVGFVRPAISGRMTPRSGPIYRKVAELPPVYPNDPPVVIYENPHVSDGSERMQDVAPERIETLRWGVLEFPTPTPALGIVSPSADSIRRRLWTRTLPAGIVWGGLVFVCGPFFRRRDDRPAALSPDGR